MTAEELHGLRTGKEKYNWLERWTQPLAKYIAEFIEGKEIEMDLEPYRPKYGYFGSQSMPQGDINITIMPGTITSPTTITGKVTDFITGKMSVHGFTGSASNAQ